jgi:hypothetical protein
LFIVSYIYTLPPPVNETPSGVRADRTLATGVKLEPKLFLTVTGLTVNQAVFAFRRCLAALHRHRKPRRTDPLRAVRHGGGEVAKE